MLRIILRAYTLRRLCVSQQVTSMSGGRRQRLYDGDVNGSIVRFVHTFLLMAIQLMAIQLMAIQQKFLRGVLQSLFVA